MTDRTHAGLALLVTLLCGAGCGTVQNLNPSITTAQGQTPPPTRIYGGVRHDWTELKEQRYDDVYCLNLYFLPLRLADFPLSFVGDTLTLPYTAAVVVARHVTDYYFPEVPSKPDQPRPMPEPLTP